MERRSAALGRCQPLHGEPRARRILREGIRGVSCDPRRARPGQVKMQKLTFVAALCGCVLAGAAHAQTFPTKPIRMVNPAAPGGNSDVFFRLLQPKMSEALGQPVVMDYRPG